MGDSTMSKGIWYHGDHTEKHIELIHPMINCQYCSTLMIEDRDEARPLMFSDPLYLFGGVFGLSGMNVKASAAVCPSCGWWKYTRFFDYMTPSNGIESYYDGWFGLLKKIDVNDIQIPCEEIHKYLIAKFDERFNVHPKKFEELVATVFNGLGYSSRVTAYSNDGGIDVFLDGPDDCLIGIQVKRYKNKIKVDQIRELTGALVLAGTTKGIFVTTSDFQSGAENAVNTAALRGICIELINAHALFDALKLSQVKSYTSIKSELPWQGFKEMLIKTNNG